MPEQNIIQGLAAAGLEHIWLPSVEECRSMPAVVTLHTEDWVSIDRHDMYRAKEQEADQAWLS